MICALSAAGIAFALTAAFDIAGVSYYLMVPAALTCALAGAGLAGIRIRFGMGAFLLMAALAVTGTALRGLTAPNLSKYYGAADHGRNLLAPLSRGAILITKHDDDFYPLLYLQRVRSERPDVILFHRPFITRTWYHAQVERLHPGFRTFDPAIVPWGRSVIPAELIRIFLLSHHGARELAYSYPAGSESTAGFALSPRGYAFGAGSPGSDQEPPREAVFLHDMLRFRLRSVFSSYPEGSRLAEVAGVCRSLWTQLAVQWWSRSEEEEARRCLARAARYPAGRISDEELDRLALRMRAP